MERSTTKAIILITNDGGYMYLAANPKENYYIDLFEDYGFDPDLDINFPREKGIYEVVIDFNPSDNPDDPVTATVMECKLVHNLEI